MIVVVIIGILAAIAIPIFANQQKSAIVAGIKSDVKNTNASIVAALTKSPKAPDVGALGATLVKSDPDTVITVGGTWDNYYIHATNKNIGIASTPQPVEAGATTTTTAPPQTRNITISNPNFESGISGWSRGGGPEGTISHETVAPISGTGSMRFDNPNGGMFVAQQSINTSVKAGETVSISFKYKSVGTDSTNYGRAYFQTGNRGATRQLSFPASAATGVTVAGTPSIDGTSVDVSIYSSSDAGSVLYVDDITGTITTPGVTTTTTAGTSYNQSSTGFGVVYSSTLGKISTQNG